MTFFSFYAQPSCTPGRAAMQTGRIPNRSGMTTVAFQGQGGGLPAAEWTLASVLKTAGYKTFFTGKWHLGEADYALPNAQGYDEMKYCGLYHLNAYTYADPDWFPDMDPELREMFQRVTKGALSGNAGEPATRGFQDQRPICQHAGQGRRRHSVLRRVRREGRARLSRPQRQIGAALLHERQLHEGAPAEHAGARSSSTSRCPRAKYADSVVENDTRIGRIMDKMRALGLDKNTYVFWTTDNGAWQDVYPDAGYTPFRGTKGTVREGGNRGSVHRLGAGHQGRQRRTRHRRRSRSTWRRSPRSAGVKLPENDREGSRSSSTATTCRRSCSARANRRASRWFYFTENELTPGAARVGNYKAVFNLRGDDGAKTGGLAVDSNLGWKGPGPVCRDRAAGLRPLAGPAGALRHLHEQLYGAYLDLVTINEAIKELMQTY